MAHGKIKQKVVGRRQKKASTIVDADNLLHLVLGLRGKRKFIPRGVYRFRSFEEAAEWSIRMMARR